MHITASAAELEYQVLKAHEVRPYLRAQAELTVTVLKDFPYCYEPDGGADEEDIDCYYKSTDTIMVGAWCNNELIGVVTGLPLEQFEDKPCGFYPEQLLGILPQLQGYFYVALLLIEKQYSHQGIGQRLMAMLEDAVRAAHKYSHMCALMLERNYQENPPPVTYDYYYERAYQRYFAQKGWMKHEPLIAYMANTKPLMRLWSVVVE